MSDLSIIIVNFNTKKLTEECIESIVKSKPKISYEIIVVDNSTDIKQKVRSKNPRVKIIDNNKNLGFAKANNIGIKNANGEHILLLNSDTIVKKSSIDKLHQFANKTPDAGVVGAKLLNEDGTTQGSVFRDPTIYRNIQEYWLGKSGMLQKYAPKTEKPVMVENLVMAAFLITQRALKEVGLLEEKYFMYFEDLDYCKKVRQAGLNVYYLPSAEVVHLHGASGKALAEKKDQWRRLIPSSKIYHGAIKHYIIYFISLTGQKWQKYTKRK